MLYNAALERNGAFNDEMKLKKLVNDRKEIVFFPITHLGTEMFYADVKNKIDSLKKKNYFFYYEKVIP
ncbi:hypothetical protein N7U66_09995 [Lacinutrix neustonica]|uniref:Uncharacterized protein n=1 Tax=Lacinutrix neustonica TaxID=2980107 RepID=A0A9E8MZ84_9FLAO|nr:hypothetical protein [Lacinutrix neustonica]WAC03721.1 hypothetical protein N7U66_09995 [Lacinutrix neustonica]